MTFKENILLETSYSTGHNFFFYQMIYPFYKQHKGQTRKKTENKINKTEQHKHWTFLKRNNAIKTKKTIKKQLF